MIIFTLILNINNCVKIKKKINMFKMVIHGRFGQNYRVSMLFTCIAPNFMRNHYTEFELGRIILTCLNYNELKLTTMN